LNIFKSNTFLPHSEILHQTHLDNYVMKRIVKPEGKIRYRYSKHHLRRTNEVFIHYSKQLLLMTECSRKSVCLRICFRYYFYSLMQLRAKV